MPFLIAAGMLVLGGSWARAQDADKPVVHVDADRAVGGCITPEDGARPLSDFSEAERYAMIACVTAEGAEQINRQLPRQIDAGTTLERVVASGTTLTYHYRLDVSAAEFSPELVEQLKAGTRANVCSQEQMRNTMAIGGAYAYAWTDRKGETIDTIRIVSCPETP
ncbi:hypothetical protein [Sphingosinithalassobacter sp. LHW66-3]|uniref:hypothetical protein n=1 Tax=Sphingosinithalassobacter sp. LHW66-3 TaxID=3424718 RepID=UPI003D6AE6E5